MEREGRRSDCRGVMAPARAGLIGAFLLRVMPQYIQLDQPAEIYRGSYSTTLLALTASHNYPAVSPTSFYSKTPLIDTDPHVVLFAKISFRFVDGHKLLSYTNGFVNLCMNYICKYTL